MGKKGDLSDFERGMVVGDRRAGLSISQTGDLLRFSHTTISRVYRERSEKEKISSERQLCGWKCLVDVKGQRRMDRLVRDDRKWIVGLLGSMFIYCIWTKYLVEAHFALITASIRRGMEVISLWHCWGGLEAQVSLTVAFSSSAFFGLLVLFFLLTIFHRLATTTF